MSYQTSQSNKSKVVSPALLRGIASVGNFFGANIPGFDGNSSDDESGIVENETYIQDGTRGIIVFKAYCVKTDRTKYFHFNPSNGIVTQYVESKKKFFSCYDVQNITFRPSDSNILVDIKRNLEVSVRQKRYIFDKDENGLLFKRYIEFYKEHGAIIRGAFDLIDRKGTRIITQQMLTTALASLDISVTYDVVLAMMSMNTDPDNQFDYHSFFHLFMDSEVSSIRECFLEWIQKCYLQSQSLDSNLGSSLSTNIFETMPGEILRSSTERVRWVIMSGKATGDVPSYRGALNITNYRIVLSAARSYYHSLNTSYQSRFDLPPFFDIISIPLSNISRISITQPKNSLHIIAKDYRHVKISFSSNSDPSISTGLLQLIEGEAFNAQIPTMTAAEADSVMVNHSTSPGANAFAFKYRKRYTNEGWSICDIRKEYLRQGLFGDGKWQLIDNSDWTYVESYPSYFMLPSHMDMSEVKQAIAHRSKGRLPAITYLHASTHAVMTRSAQPLVGLTMKSCDADLTLLNLYRLKGLPPSISDSEAPTKFYIFDARRQIAATLNMAAGKGTEDASIYNNTDLIFCDIDNIHVMRMSAITFADCNLPGAFAPTTSSSTSVHIANGSNIITSSAGTPLAGHRIGVSGNISSNIDMTGSGAGYYSKIEESGWLRYLRLIINASVMVAEKMHLEGASVLIHCSDGWDRTSQICGVAQVLLDPYFRTIQGFAVLIEKDWCAFGHKFHDRAGHCEDYNRNADERSPVFLQFLDCVYQILTQFPNVFEFNDYFLCFIADHFNSSLFGNFLGNTDKQRVSELLVQDMTRSIWSHVLDNKGNFTNSKYLPHPRPIWPSCSMARFAIWHRYFSRWDHEMHFNKCSGEDWHDDWGNGFETKPSAEKTSYRYIGREKYNPRDSGDLSGDRRSAFTSKEAEPVEKIDSITADP